MEILMYRNYQGTIEYSSTDDTPLPEGSGFLKISLINSIFNQLFFLSFFY